jgi:trk system potassium uptake protein TrkH
MRAFIIFTLGLVLIIVVTMILSITEVGTSLEYLIYEATSAFATVGLSLGLTPELSFIGKIVIAITMYFGRVGPMTVALALASKKNKSSVRYPEDKILVG